MKRIFNIVGPVFKNEYLRFISIGLIFVFSLLPMFTLIFQISGKDLSFVFSDKNFADAIVNSIVYSLVSTIISILLALLSAYLLNQTTFKHKNIFAVILTLGMLVPTLSVGLGVRTLFGNNGFLDKFLSINNDMIGMPGLIIGSVCASFPTAFLLIYDALKYENKAPYDAAEIMGISKLSTFFKLTLPYLKVTLISTFFATFTLIFSDYGIPMELAGKTNTLPIYLYNSILSEFQYGRGSIAGLFLLLPALVSFIFDIFFKDNSNEEKQKRMIKPSRAFDYVAGGLLTIISFLLFLPQLAFIALTFIKAFPNNMDFTFDNYANLFVGSSTANKLWQYLGNSVLISLMTGVLGTILAYVLGYVVSRKEGIMGKITHLLSVSTIAIPGIVLGIGYMLLFKATKPIFYGTIMILVVVNIFHFLGSPYLLAKNGLSKINKDYELIGDTLGISRSQIIFRVLIPNSIPTIIEMFSYFFLNSMITISAVAFLSTIDNQPLAISITTYEKTGNYEMQGTISVLLFLVNLISKGLLNGTNALLKKRGKGRSETDMITEYQFNILTFVAEKKTIEYNLKSISNDLKMSLNTTQKVLEELFSLNYLGRTAENKLIVSEKGEGALKPFKVRKAIILAAGFGSRLAPVTLDTPKPLIKINGVRIIDTLLDALIAQGIDDIIIVRGYKRKQFDQLLEKYPNLKFIDNNEFNTTNSISSLLLAEQFIDQCYICDGDLFIENPTIIKKYQYSSKYYGAKVVETDDWCFRKTNKIISSYQLGGTDCYQSFGISYWNQKDCEQLKKDLKKVYNSRGGKENFWEAVPFKYYKKNYKIEINSCHKNDLTEIDTFQELISLDNTYKDYPGHEDY